MSFPVGMNVVTLLPSATEIVCALGLRKSLVAVSHECDFPEEVTSLPRITRSLIPGNLLPHQVDEAVVRAVREGKALYQVDGDLLGTLNPHLIITQGVCDVCAVNQGTVRETLLFLPDWVSKEIRILSLSGKTFEGILRDVRQVGEATNTLEKADSLNQEWRRRWQQLQQTGPETKPKVLMLEWPDPFFFGGHWVPEMVEAAGGVDVLGQIGMDSRRCTLGEIQEKDPDIILFIACGHDLKGNVGFARQLVHDPAFRKLRAVKNGNLWAADANSYFSRPSPRIVEGARKLQAIFNENTPGVDGIERVSGY